MAKKTINGVKHKTYIVAFLDDASRLIVSCKAFKSDNLLSVLEVFKDAVATRGVPKKVFSQVETMKKIGLDVPQVTELSYELRKEGIDIDSEILNIDEMVDALCQLR